jgi:hypothetical protein
MTNMYANFKDKDDYEQQLRIFLRTTIEVNGTVYIFNSLKEYLSGGGTLPYGLDNEFNCASSQEEIENVLIKFGYFIINGYIDMTFGQSIQTSFRNFLLKNGLLTKLSNGQKFKLFFDFIQHAKIEIS